MNQAGHHRLRPVRQATWVFFWWLNSDLCRGSHCVVEIARVIDTFASHRRPRSLMATVMIANGMLEWVV